MSVESPVHSEYFLTCIQGAKAAGLTFLGQTIIDSNQHELRRKVIISDSEVPVVALMRVTTLFFSLPGKAFLLCTVFKEEIDHDYGRARKGERVELPRHPYWTFHIFLGAHPGKWSQDNSGWVFLPSSFEGANLPMHVQDHSDKYPRAQFSFGSCGPADKDPQVQDGRYKVVLGYYPVEPTAALFAEAVGNMVRQLDPHARPGKLGGLTGGDIFDLPPWLDFRGCEDSFWAQFPPETVADLFVRPVTRPSYDRKHHDEVRDK